MATIRSEKIVDIDGHWNITWRPETSSPQTGTLILDTNSGTLSVKMETSIRSGACQGAVEGNKLSWSIPLGTNSRPLEFTAVVEGDEISGRVDTGMFPFGAGSLEGTRSGSNVQLLSREGSDAVAEALIKCGVEFVFGSTPSDVNFCFPAPSPRMNHMKLTGMSDLLSLSV